MVAPRADSGGELRARILTAAHDLFTKQGYQSTTTKEISARARVAEPTVFRHFGSKVELFEASILEPFNAVVDEWTQSWADMPTEITLEELAENLVDGLYTLVWEDRRILRELMAARSDPQSALHQSAVAISAQFREGFSSVLEVGVDIARTRELVYVDPPATIGAVASMIIGSVLLGDWAYPANRRTPGRTRMVREMARLIVDGIAHRHS
ncbi:helix-turn-helix domain containing protein [Mycobacterium sp. CVI_P3]|uniref:Helix-turn-helix domain containing protein n=1 Tax=Mycobacterium pinniadriaticum TaxID=2994102 RepID=A0ABT3SBM4_9MYCO|nr:TetR/AcrR family transcriptional regulator [Mycobacterium pinniadriaticum]MCX2930074.1 helix-turn-helix domain containing protein [Mycobacterium pinniadriaticum]MCX2936277.1 helix-turn-helix domain containing protein [Mycobacterium pinniadriaticum]